MMTFRLLWIAAGAAALAAGAPVHAADPADAAPAGQTAPAQRIAIDPRTGMFAAAPPATSTAAPAPAVRSAPLAGVRLQSGATRVDLKGRYRMAVVAHVDAAGGITTTCEPASGSSANQDSTPGHTGEAPNEK
jgi:FtsP/CotA-like multicopper oxidase with cupredoxin domain